MRKNFEGDKDFARSKKVFFDGKVSDTESVFNANTAKFYGANDAAKTNLDHNKFVNV